MTQVLTLEQPTRRADPPRVVWFAAAGIAFVALEVYIFSRWILSDDFKTTPVGDDPLSLSTKVWCWIIIIAPITAMVLAIRRAIGTTRLEGRLSFDAMLVLGWLSAMWQDNLSNFYRPTMFSNAYQPNFGSWAPYIPGWVSPNGARFPEPLLQTIPCYLGLFPMLSIGACVLMERVARRRPTMSRAGVIAVAYLWMCATIFMLEIFFIRTGVYALPAAIHELTLWAGETYQYPVYEFLCVAAIMTIPGALRFLRNERGESAIDKGLHSLAVSKRRRSTVRAFAMCGFINMGFLVGFNIPQNVLGFYSDEAPTYPSYLTAGICGPGTGYECPGPDTPVYLETNPPEADAASGTE